MTIHQKKVTSLQRRIAVTVLGAVMALTTMIPAATASAKESARTVCRWIVARNGDSLGELAIRYRTDVLAIRRANGLRTTRIYIGQRLCIPTVVADAPRPAPAPNPGGGVPTGPWYGEYWNNTGQSGLPVAVRNDAAINFSWGFGSPDPTRVFADNFSARWTRQINFDGGIYRFGVQADDGFRLYVDGNLVMDRFGFEGNGSQAVDVSVPPGVRTVRLDYVEKSGLALVKFNYFKLGNTPGSGGGAPVGSLEWRAEYFNNRDLAGSPVRIATVRELNFNWAGGSPGANIPADNFSARFTQYRSFVGGTYRFVAQVDDGIRIYVDDQLVINEWREQSYRTFVGDVNIAPGMHTVRVEFQEYRGSAALRVYAERR
jgi:hypothetical protein